MIANVAAILLLVRSLTGSSGEAEASPPVGHEAPISGTLEAGGSAQELPASSPGSPFLEGQAPRDSQIQDDVLLGQIEGHIATALREASKRSSGKATASNTVIAVQVFEPASGRALVSRQSRVPLRPASTMKLVTSAAALVALGADWEFRTAFESSAPISSGVLQGDLIVRAGADPFYDAGAAGKVSHLLRPAVTALRERGIRAIEGDLILDEGTYLEPGPAPGWPASNQHWQEHCALSAGFTANAGCLTAVVHSRRSGERAFSEVRPIHNGLTRVGSVKTASAGARLNIAVGATATRATLRGEIPASVPSWNSRFAHPDPVGLFERSLRAALDEGGVELRGAVRRQRRTKSQETLAVLGTPLARMLAPINRDSNNAVADQLFLALGDARSGSGTRQGGARAVVGALETLGVSAEGLVQVDGSGLSREDRVTAEQLSSLLAAVLELEASPRQAFIESLSIAGRAGSLENRMKNEPALGRVFAKTGWIEGTGSLAGYVETLSGRWLCFSILVDYPKVSGLNKYCWKPMQDAICSDLVTWGPPKARVR